jgi:hypothetical protein
VRPIVATAEPIARFMLLCLWHALPHSVCRVRPRIDQRVRVRRTGQEKSESRANTASTLTVAGVGIFIADSLVETDRECLLAWFQRLARAAGNQDVDRPMGCQVDARPADGVDAARYDRNHPFL